MTFPTEGTILALQPDGNRLRAVTVERQNGQIRSATIRELESDTSSVLAMVAETDAVGILIMLPGSAMVVRTALLPGGGPRTFARTGDPIRSVVGLRTPRAPNGARVAPAPQAKAIELGS